MACKENGFSLMELMVTLTIFAVGILGIARLQFLSFRNMEQGVLRTVAILEVSNLLVQYRLWYGEDTFQAAFTAWQQQLEPLLPGAKVQFAAHDSFCTIHLSWQPLATIFNADGTPRSLVDTLDYPSRAR